ncbi:MAG: NAD(P)-dependent oxidoreductase [Chloroflexota bacterium]|nr:NAD(P)-dependent oxidoreductase [Chloroflexota bacterium]
MKVVVTGGSGLAGSAVLWHLLDTGYDVLSVDRRPPPHPIAEFRLVDCEDLGQVYGASHGADAIVHLAAIPRPIHHTPDQVFGANIMATFNIFEAAAALQIPRVVYVSSMSVLGLPFSYQPIRLAYLPIDEAHPKAPQDAYALSKTLGEDIALAFVRRMAGALSVVSLRFPWIHSPATFKSVLTPLWDDPAGGATNLWGYIDTRDVARACRLALEADISGHEAFYISARNTFMKADSASLAQTYYPQAKARSGLAGNQSLFDTSKARRALGYEPHYCWEDYEWN